MQKSEAEQPLVSIITPSFNQGKFIQKTIDSVLEQTYPNIELIVMDGGSTDETLDILKKVQGKVKYVSEKDNGQTDAINKGMRMASGEILTFLNSDDYFFPDTVELAVKALQSTGRLWVSGDYQIVNAEGKPIQNAIALYKRILRKCSSKTLIRITNYIIQPGTFWRRALQEQAGDFDASLRYVMDYDFWLRAFQIEEPYILSEKLSAFRIHQSSKGGAQFVKQFDEELEVVKRYSTSKTLFNIHRAHNGLIKAVYRMIK